MKIYVCIDLEDGHLETELAIGHALGVAADEVCSLHPPAKRHSITWSTDELWEARQTYCPKG